MSVAISEWEYLTEEEAIEAAVERYGRDPLTALAYCALETNVGWETPEYRFWCTLFIKLDKERHVGWA